MFKLNTSNKGKQQEFIRLFTKYGKPLAITEVDLKEIVADPVTVVTHKASQLDEEVIVDDSSLDIEGAEVGIHVKSLLAHLDKYVGRRAIWTALLAYRKKELIYIYCGQVSGVIVAARGSAGFGFDPVFLPAGSHKTLAEDKPDALNARALAVDALLLGRVYATKPLLKEWHGPWQ